MCAPLMCGIERARSSCGMERARSSGRAIGRASSTRNFCCRGRSSWSYWCHSRSSEVSGERFHGYFIKFLAVRAISSLLAVVSALDGMPSENSAFAGTDALLPNGQPNLYSVAGNQIHGERLKKQNLVDSEWWARHRRVADLKFQYAVGAVPDKKKLVWPEQPKMKLGLEAADSVSDAEFLRMSTMQSDFYWGQTSELWDYYNKTGALQKKTYNKKGLPNCAHGSRTSRRRSARAFPRPPLTSRRRPLRCRLRGDAARHQRGRHRLLLQSALTLRMPRAGAWSVAAPRHAVSS